MGRFDLHDDFIISSFALLLSRVKKSREQALEEALPYEAGSLAWAENLIDKLWPIFPWATSGPQ